MTGQAWVSEFAAKLGIDPPDPATFNRLLDLAGIAAHSSERIAAPIACYLVGKTDRDLDEAIELASGVTPED